MLLDSSNKIKTKLKCTQPQTASCYKATRVAKATKAIKDKDYQYLQGQQGKKPCKARHVLLI